MSCFPHYFAIPALVVCGPKLLHCASGLFLTILRAIHRLPTMHMLTRRFFLTGLGLSLSLRSVPCVIAAGQDNTQVKVVLFSVPETVWQAKLEGRHLTATDLHTRLEERAREQEAQRVVHVLCTLKDDGTPFEWRRGETRKLTTGWQITGGKPEVRPKHFADHFVGTALTLSHAGLQPDGTLTVALKLEHHTAPPGMRRINFANAAEGAERDRLSVEYPEFATLEWSGKAILSTGCTLVAQMLHAPDESENEKPKEKANAVPAQRHLLFITRATP